MTYHIDDWLKQPAKTETEKDVKEWLRNARKPLQEKDYRWLERFVILCTYQGTWYRCTGSDLNDVWLTWDYSRSNIINIRVNVMDCSDWRVLPAWCECGAKIEYGVNFGIVFSVCTKCSKEYKIRRNHGE